MNNSSREYRKPSERAAGFVLNIFGWIKYIIGSTNNVIPRGHVVQHYGRDMEPERTLQYPYVLLVEDDPNTAGDFVDVIKLHYKYGAVTVFVAHVFEAAINFFENEKIDLVIMDADLDDEDGDGVDLTRRFLSRKPHLTILANSSSKISNHKLIGFGAKQSLGKNPEKLKDWLSLNDPAGNA